MVEWRTRTSLDDTLDVFPCHGVGGISGMILTAVFAHKSINSSVTTNGLFFGETKLFLVHIVAVIGVSVFAFVGSYILLKVTDMITPLRVTADEEKEGLDWSQHGEKL
jgi:Amt family ammonium transporter